MEQMAYILQGGESRSIVQVDLSIEERNTQESTADSRMKNSAQPGMTSAGESCSFMPRHKGDAKDTVTTWSRIEIDRGDIDRGLGALASEDITKPRMERYVVRHYRKRLYCRF